MGDWEIGAKSRYKILPFPQGSVFQDPQEILKLWMVLDLLLPMKKFNFSIRHSKRQDSPTIQLDNYNIL